MFDFIFHVNLNSFNWLTVIIIQHGLHRHLLWSAFILSLFQIWIQRSSGYPFVSLEIWNIFTKHYTWQIDLHICDFIFHINLNSLNWLTVIIIQHGLYRYRLCSSFMLSLFQIWIHVGVFGISLYLSWNLDWYPAYV